VTLVKTRFSIQVELRAVKCKALPAVDLKDFDLMLMAQGLYNIVFGYNMKTACFIFRKHCAIFFIDQ
jgi:hypothetical protein